MSYIPRRTKRIDTLHTFFESERASSCIFRVRKGTTSPPRSIRRLLSSSFRFNKVYQLLMRMHSKLCAHVRNVGLHRIVRNDQGLLNITSITPVRQEQKHLPFTLG